MTSLTKIQPVTTAAHLAALDKMLSIYSATIRMRLTLIVAAQSISPPVQEG